MENNYGFREHSVEGAILEFENDLGKDNIWFVEFITELKDYISLGNNVTDILIKSNQIPQVGILKSFFPFFYMVEGKIFKPSEDQLKKLQKKLTYMKGGEENEAPEKTVKYPDISFSVYGVGSFRVNFSEDAFEMGMVIRYLDFMIPDIGTMGYSTYYIKSLENQIMRQDILISSTQKKGDEREKTTMELSTIKQGGLILHVGSTGSGKTTAIASEITYLAENISGLILTYENPIEYRILATKAPVRQFEIGYHIKDEQGNDFNAIKRHLLRNAPSVIMLGELRTREEITEALDIANRGHLVFSTIHSNNTFEALSMLMSLGEDARQLLSAALISLTAHKLVVNKKGEIVPLLETFIPEDALRKNIREGNIKTIESSVFVEKKYQGKCVTFKEHLDILVKKGSLEKEEAEGIRAANWVTFK